MDSARGSRCSKEAKLESFTPRDLRATFATHLVNVGRSMAEVGDLLGHADGGITAAKHYARYQRGTAALDLRTSGRPLTVNIDRKR